jgi:hypothetical protein
LHGKIDEMHAYTISLEAKLKEPIPTSCSTCELHALKNLELAHYVDHLQDENDELRKLRSLVRRNRLRSRVERNQVSSPIPSPSLRSRSSIVIIVGEMVTIVSFASRGSMRREWRRSGLTRKSTTLPMVYLSLVCRCPGPRLV